MLLVVLALLAGAAADPAPATPAPAEKRVVRRIAVYRLEGGGIDERILDVLTDSVVKELRKLERVTVVGMDEIRAMLDLEAQKQVLGCTDVSCVAEIAEALGVDEVVIGNVAVVGETISFGLKRIDQKNATTLGQHTSRLDSSDPADVLVQIGPAVQELLPEVPLRPDMTRGVPPEVAARIHPPPLDPWVFWSVAGSAGALTLGGVGFTLVNAMSFSSATQKLEASTTGPAASGQALAVDRSALQQSFIGLAACYAAGAVVGAGAGVVALFTDWDDVRGAQ
ncbi:MAG: hypothetical protein IT383_09980 [Deltaproteobacteria bacterium]|nr:hypothetical protein [Deltaproteobacteria bacterium]